MLKRKQEEKVKPKHALEEAIGFTFEDLEINDSGVLSIAQRQTLKRDLIRWLLFNMPFVALYILTYRGFQSGTYTYDDIGRGILLCLLALPIFLFTLNNWVRLLLDLISGKVGKTEGNIELDVVSDKGGTRYKLLTQGILFQIAKPIFLAFKNNEPYRLYFAPYSKTIVSAEWLRHSAD